MKNILALLTMAATAATISLNAQLPAALSDVVANEDGSLTNWIGTITPEGEFANPGWIQHAEHGRLWASINEENVFLFDPQIRALNPSASGAGWIYTNRNVHPWFYLFGEDARWIYYIPGVSGPAGTTRIFADPSNRGTILLPSHTPENIIEVALAAGSFGSLATALTTADLVETLQTAGPFTVFAPTDDAFAKLDEELLNALLTDPDQLETLTSILLYHVVPGRLSSGDLGLDMSGIFGGLTSTRYLTTLAGTDIKLVTTPFGVMIDGTSQVIIPDIATQNGVIHVIDTVLLPPADIVDTAVAAGLSTLAAAVTAADLVDTLKGPGPFTVFAPTNEAFAAIQSTVDTLLLPENKDALVNVLTYHVVAGSVYAADVALGDIIMLNGAPAEITQVGDDLFINGAQIIATDIKTRNGVVHLIDAVIVPPMP